MERGSGIAPGPFLHAAFPNRTCELSPHPALHKAHWASAALICSCGHGDGIVVPLGRYRVVTTEPGLNRTTSPSRGHHPPSQ